MFVYDLADNVFILIISFNKWKYLCKTCEHNNVENIPFSRLEGHMTMHNFMPILREAKQPRTFNSYVSPQ